MTVRYDEDQNGMFWVDGDQRGESQKDLHHAMKDYESRSANAHTNQEGGEEFHFLGYAGQEADGSGSEEGAGGLEDVSSGDSTASDESGGEGAESEDDPEE